MWRSNSTGLTDAAETIDRRSGAERIEDRGPKHAAKAPVRRQPEADRSSAALAGSKPRSAALHVALAVDGEGHDADPRVGRAQWVGSRIEPSAVEHDRPGRAVRASSLFHT